MGCLSLRDYHNPLLLSTANSCTSASLYYIQLVRVTRCGVQDNRPSARAYPTTRMFSEGRGWRGDCHQRYFRDAQVYGDIHEPDYVRVLPALKLTSVVTSRSRTCRRQNIEQKGSFSLFHMLLTICCRKKIIRGCRVSSLHALDATNGTEEPII